MKVHIFRPETEPGDIVLAVKSVNFTEPRREAMRDFIKYENAAQYVWFEDEPPPQEIVDAILEARRQMAEEN